VCLCIRKNTNFCTFLLYICVPRDVQTAEELLNHHAEVGDDIRAKQDEFSQLIALGEKMYKR
jgi:hypothetical protein